MRDLIDAPDLAAFADTEGSAFTVRSAAGAELVLDEVDTRRNTRDDWERFTLLFRGPTEKRFESGIHRVDHPRLDAFDMDLRPVQTMNPDPDVMHYQATFNRHVPDREPHRSFREADTSRRGFFGKLAAAVGGAGLFGSLFGSETARAESRGAMAGDTMGVDPFVGEIILFGGNFAIRDYAECNGQLLNIAQNQALFSLLGSIYGGDGRSTFGLPDLRGRVPLHRGQSSGTSLRRLGDTGGQEQVTLGTGQIPSHNHGSSLPVSTDEADATTPGGNTLGVQPNSRGTVPVYDGSGGTGGSMTVDSNDVGSGAAHDNMPPFAVVSYQIALVGTFPSRN